MAEDLVAMKAAIRREVLALRAAVPDAQRQSWSAAMVARIGASAAFRETEVFCSYVPMAEEIQVQSLAREAARRGCRVLLPAFDAGARLYRWRVWDVACPLVSGHWQIPEPVGSGFDVPRGRICILVPGVAFDLQGNRIGYGAGYYDRLLAAARGDRGNEVHVVGAAYPFQVRTSLPTAAHDQSLDALATVDAWHAFQAVSPCHHFDHEIQPENKRKGE